MKVPLVSIFGASNETPEDETLSALYDRFLVRILVNFVEDENAFSKIVFGKAGSIAIKTKLSIKELELISKSAKKVKVPKAVQEMIITLKHNLAEIGVILSDRRWKQLVGFLKTLTSVSNRSNVQETDLLILQEMLWNEPAQIEAIKNIVWNVVVSAERDADALQIDVKNTLSTLKKTCMKTVQKKDNYGYDTRETEQKKIEMNEVSFNMYMKQIRELEKDLKLARKKVGDRRKKYETQLVDNIWVEASGLIEDVETELTGLSKVESDLSALRLNVEGWPIEGDKEEEDEEDDREGGRRGGGAQRRRRR